MGVSTLQQKNIAAAAAYTEYSFIIPARAKMVTLNVRSGNQPVFWYMASSPNATNNAAGLPAVYNTIPAGASRTIDGMLDSQTIYFQTPGTTQLLEVDYYADL
jgi:hypothetical protein